MGYLNILSLVMGCLAWGLPLSVLVRRNTNRQLFASLSFAACSIALLGQILYTNHLIQINDTIALLDTQAAVVFASQALIIGTLALNSLPILKDRFLKKA